MTRLAIIPEETRSVSEALKLSPAILSGSHVFLTGVTGSDVDGSIPNSPELQFRNAFDKVEGVLIEAGLTLAAVVEMTSYHIDLSKHFDLFSTIRQDYVKEPYPAWTAVEVAGLRREGAIVEIRVIAATD